MSSKRYLFTTTIIAGALAALTPAYAQQDPQPPEAPVEVAGTQDADEDAQTEASPQAGEQDEGTVEGVVVTGSRLRRNEFTSPNPIQVLSSEAAALRGVADTADLLQSSTLAAGSPQVNATISSAFVTNGGPGAQTVSLRGLGPERSLVLLNNRRAGPAGTRGSVSAFDLNVIPQSAIERVEILKDGASSVYGSDAVAGVVNIITKRNTDGIELEAFASAPFDGGGESYQVSGTWGRTFDRGFLSISADYYEQTEQTLGDREYTTCPEEYVFNPATGARIDTIDARTGRFACLGTAFDQVFVYDFSGRPVPNGRRLQFDYTGQIGTLVPQSRPGSPTNPTNIGVPPGWVWVGGPAPTANGQDPQRGVIDALSQRELDSTLIPNTTRATVFAQAGFDVTPNLEAYAEVLLNRRETTTNGFRQFWSYVYGEDSGDPFSAGFTGPFFSTARRWSSTRAWSAASAAT
jgi:iron complex outermembrane receptor protein